MMIGRYTHTIHTPHTRTAMEARPDKQIIWRRHYSLYECNNWFHYLVGISATLNEELDSVWFPKAGWSRALSLLTMGLCLHDVFSGPYLKSQSVVASASICFKVVFSKRIPFFEYIWSIYSASACVCVLLYILSVRETVVGGTGGGEAYFNGLLKEINGLQMAQSIYSNETWSLAMSIEQRAGGGGGGSCNSTGHD